jgi:hypothetical protein
MRGVVQKHQRRAGYHDLLAWGHGTPALDTPTKVTPALATIGALSMPSSVLEVMQNYKIYDASRQVLLALAA